MHWCQAFLNEVFTSLHKRHVIWRPQITWDADQFELKTYGTHVASSLALVQLLGPAPLRFSSVFWLLWQRHTQPHQVTESGRRPHRNQATNLKRPSCLQVKRLCAVGLIGSRRPCHCNGKCQNAYAGHCGASHLKRPGVTTRCDVD